jgi:hypothetical protein
MTFSGKLARRLGIGVFSAFILLTLLGGIMGIFCWPYGINTWLVFAGKPVAIHWYHGFIIGIIPFFGKFSIVFAVLTWIIMMFL